MSFISEEFFAFLLIAFALYYLLPKKLQPYILLAANYVFYACSGITNVIYILLTTGTTYGVALWMTAYTKGRREAMKQQDLDRDAKKAYKSKTERNTKLMLAASLVINFGVLAYVKYYGHFANFVNTGLANAGSAFRLPIKDILLPLGISFFTFQAVGYAVDVYREKIEPERNFFRYALFVSFFPQLVQGPIGRYNDLAPQLVSEHEVNWNGVKHGFLLMLWGYLKKIVLSENIVAFVDSAYAAPENLNGIRVLIAGLAFGIQIYGDFSGGIDIARGAARCFGIEMAENFNQPYFSETLAGFWRRWHITLGSWMRDYVFYTLAVSKLFSKLGKRCKQYLGNEAGKLIPTCVNLFINFLLVGIWHGPNLKYVIYGLYNGLIISVGALTEPFIIRITEKGRINRSAWPLRILRMVRTLLIVTLGHVILRADTWGDAKRMLKKLFTTVAGPVCDWRAWFCPEKMDGKIWILIAFCLILLFIVGVLREKYGKLTDTFDAIPAWGQMLIFVTLTVFLLFFGVYGIGYDSSSFLYGGF